MNREDIIRMAREAGLLVIGTADGGNAVYTWPHGITDELERFAGLVAKHEREACAKLCDAVQKKNEDDGAWMWEARNCAAAIRARGEKP